MTDKIGNQDVCGCGCHEDAFDAARRLVQTMMRTDDCHRWNATVVEAAGLILQAMHQMAHMELLMNGNGGLMCEEVVCGAIARRNELSDEINQNAVQYMLNDHDKSLPVIARTMELCGAPFNHLTPAMYQQAYQILLEHNEKAKQLRNEALSDLLHKLAAKGVQE